MPDLDRTPVMDWVAACIPNLLAWCEEPVRAIEDEEEVRLALAELGSSLDAPCFEGDGLRAGMNGTDAARDLRTTLAQLGPARLVRLLRWLGTEGGPGRAAILQLIFNNTHPDALALQAALDALNRRELLDRIFDEERLRQLLAATKTAREGADT